MYKKGHKHSEEVKEKIRQSKLGTKNPMYGGKFTKEHRRRMSEGQRNRIHDPKQWENMHKVRKGYKVSDETKEKNRQASMGNSSHRGFRHKFSDEIKAKMSRIHKRIWAQGEEYRNKRVRNILRGSHIRPNKAEIQLLELVQGIDPDNWKYTGNGKVIICGRNPDIVNINGKKSAILLHGVYWHLWSKQKENPELTKEDVEREDMNFYKTYGWDCLIVWEDELKEPDKVKEKVEAFINK